MNSILKQKVHQGIHGGLIISLVLGGISFSIASIFFIMGNDPSMFIPSILMSLTGFIGGFFIAYPTNNEIITNTN